MRKVGWRKPQINRTSHRLQATRTQVAASAGRSLVRVSMRVFLWIQIAQHLGANAGAAELEMRAAQYSYPMRLRSVPSCWT